MSASRQYFEEFAMIRKRVKTKRNLGISMPTDRRLVKVEKEYQIKIKYCTDRFVTRDRTIDAGGDMSLSLKPQVKIKGAHKLSRKENAQSIKCKIYAEYEYLRTIIKLLKGLGDKLCSDNHDKQACAEWIRTALPRYEEKMIAVRHGMRSLRGDPERDYKVFQMIPFHDDNTEEM